MSTSVFVAIDGVVNHSHAGRKGFHGPWVRHAHEGDVAKPTNFAALTKEQKAQYADALKAGTNYDKLLWEPAKNARVAAGKIVRGPGKAKEAVEAAEAIIAQDLVLQNEG